jgi:hypothetical protein
MCGQKLRLGMSHRDAALKVLRVQRSSQTKDSTEMKVKET